MRATAKALKKQVAERLLEKRLLENRINELNMELDDVVEKYIFCIMNRRR